MTAADATWSTNVTTIYQCVCCGTPIPITAISFICLPCMKNVVLRSPRRMMCKLHKNTINPEEVTPSDSSH